MSTLAVGTIKSATSAAPVFQNSSGVEIGQLAFAWYNIDPDGSASIASSFNISSVTENNQNTYTIAFTRAASSANYAVAIDVETETEEVTEEETPVEEPAEEEPEDEAAEEDTPEDNTESSDDDDFDAEWVRAQQIIAESLAEEIEEV